MCKQAVLLIGTFLLLVGGLFCSAQTNRRDTIYVYGLAASAGSESAAPFAKEPGLAFLVRTNVLAVPLANIGIEIPVGRHWSVGADWYYPWIWRKKHNYDIDKSGHCNELQALDVEGRYWFRASNTEAGKMHGHSIGMYAAGGYYDFERNWSGHQGWFYNVGLDYLWAVPVFNGKVRLEFEVGLGYIHSKAQPYDCFVPGEKCYKRKGVRKNVNWFGPARAQISVVVPVYIKSGGRK